jgi:hypothetical protein
VTSTSSRRRRFENDATRELVEEGRRLRVERRRRADRHEACRARRAARRGRRPSAAGAPSAAGSQRATLAHARRRKAPRRRPRAKPGLLQPPPDHPDRTRNDDRARRPRRSALRREWRDDPSQCRPGAAILEGRRRRDRAESLRVHQDEVCRCDPLGRSTYRWRPRRREHATRARVASHSSARAGSKRSAKDAPPGRCVVSNRLRRTGARHPPYDLVDWRPPQVRNTSGEHRARARYRSRT